MKILFTAIALCIATFQGVHAQKAEKKISEIYSKAELENLKEFQSRYEVLLKYAEKGIHFIESDRQLEKYEEIEIIYLKDKITPCPISEFIEDLKSPDFNHIKYAWRPGTIRQYLHIANTSIYLVIPSLKDL